MVLVDPKVLEALPSSSSAPAPPLPPPPPPPVDSTKQQLATLDDDMRRILDSKDISTYDKSQLYHQTLRRYMDFHEQYKKRPLGTVQIAKDTFQSQEQDGKSEGIEEEVVATVPASLKTKARSLLKRLQNDPNVSWNKKGELVFQGDVQKNSNIVDLVNDVVRRRRQPPPRGWTTFARVLKEGNVPRDLIGNPERWSYLNTTSSTSSSSSTVGSDIEDAGGAVKGWVTY